jgi:hypothetical protein
MWMPRLFLKEMRLCEPAGQQDSHLTILNYDSTAQNVLGW